MTRPAYRVLAIFAVYFTILVMMASLPLLNAQRSIAAPYLQPRTYVVQPGDSLGSIADEARVSVEELMAMNDIQDADSIVIGQTLLLPVDSQSVTVDEPPQVQVDEQYVSSASESEHVVSAGESLSEIAQQYRLELDELMALNGIVDPNHVIVGQRLRLTHAMDTGEALEAEVTPAAAVQEPDIERSNLTTSLNRVYSFAEGDDISRIAIRFGVDEQSFRALNNLAADRTVVEIGQPLVLPATAQELQVEAAQPVNKRLEHEVQKGDSLSRIAEQYGYTLAELMDANYITSPDSIYIGQKILIPEKEVEPQTELVTVDEIGRPRTGFYYYTVKRGDTLSELAREFDSTQLAIMEYNSLPDTETVFNGLPLRIPYGPPPLPVETPPTPLAGTRFLVSLSRQQCWVLDGDEVLYQWTCSTGYGQWITRTGSFSVQTMQEMAGSNAYELDMPYWLGIYDVGSYENGIHGLPIKWSTGQRIWEGLVGMPATFGCAMLDDSAASTLYDLAYLGMPVYIVP